ncbi:transposase family protein [Leptolyngbya cf. ectocarpi LEGE 11479]|uniref:Transposase family protein n=1 Tax=Leptolyngbya cf. ectocarpi LEGE 11479 TaxID=1828722 RepID=A0A929FBG9_LEPEC|nr:transposase family protein [Leptolyngbya ectocarpi]MBE9070731.1 transposase family protein [Leptolyngbya cf. ectocarpi LEGE 11479]
MKNPYDYINQNPERCQRMFGLGYQEFSDLIAVIVSNQSARKDQLSPAKVYINAPGGCPPKLSEAEEVSLCLLYLRQYPTFELLGLHYDVCESTAHDIYHRWVLRLRHHLPSSWLEELGDDPEQLAWLQAILAE